MNIDSEQDIRARRSDTFNRMFPGPLTEAQRSFFTLRDSGYMGWIDQDGFPVAEPTAWCSTAGGQS